jgi:aspartyl-tRNA(Asn)/glutamyl-tRNA(Gln) amidotransferase subunit C
MKIDEKLILRLENLARLQLSETERPAFQQDLNNILEMMQKLDELDTEGVEPLRHVTEGLSEWREDKVEQPITKVQALQNAPLHDGDYFKVPKVINI